MTLEVQLGLVDIPIVIAALSFWSSLYFVLCHVDHRHSCEWHCRIVTGMHGIVITSMAAWCAFVQGPWPFTDSGGSNTPLQWLTVIICLGYFIFDFAWCLYFSAEGYVMLVHHTLSIFGLCMCLIFGKWGTELVATICAGEMTNPLLQLRWFFKETGNYDTWYGELNDIVFMLLFGFIRIGVGSALLYSYFHQPTDFLGRFGGVCIYFIGWVFFINIVQFGINKYRKKWRAYKLKRDDTLKLDREQNGELYSDSNSVIPGNNAVIPGNNAVIRGNNSAIQGNNSASKRNTDVIKQNGAVNSDNVLLTSVKENKPSSSGDDGFCLKNGEHVKKLVEDIWKEIPSADACLRHVVNPGGDNSKALINDLVRSGHVSCLCTDTEEKKML